MADSSQDFDAAVKAGLETWLGLCGGSRTPSEWDYNVVIGVLEAARVPALLTQLAEAENRANRVNVQITRADEEIERARGERDVALADLAEARVTAEQLDEAVVSLRSRLDEALTRLAAARAALRAIPERSREILEVGDDSTP